MPKMGHNSICKIKLENDDMENREKNKNYEASREIDAKDIAWKMFKKSGNINYYRLYSDLKKKDD